MSNFEERLLNELRDVVAAGPVDRGQRRPVWRGPRLVLAGGLAALLAAAAGAGVFLLTAGTQAAYAVTRNADGTITVEIDSLTDAAGLEAKLRAAGVSAVVEYLPAGKMCKRPRPGAGPRHRLGQGRRACLRRRRRACRERPTRRSSDRRVARSRGKTRPTRSGAAKTRAAAP